ncbi:MAG TPA: hypothetical protein DDZ88_20655 [Verrucomicrobiales bacterium]|nr:hypothetical protein [Verrucomicrobiales bacterium]
MGIQTAAYADGAWWLGCYGKPTILLRADENYRLIGKWEFDASVGIVPLDRGIFRTCACQRDQDRNKIDGSCPRPSIQFVKSSALSPGASGFSVGETRSFLSRQICAACNQWTSR